MGHRRQNGSFIAEQLAFVAAFPEPPLAAILGICASRNGFGQTAHQPRQIAQSPAQLGQVGRVAENAQSLVLAGDSVVVSRRKEHQPALDDNVVVPCGDVRRVDISDDVQMVAHHRIGENICGEA